MLIRKGFMEMAFRGWYSADVGKVRPLLKADDLRLMRKCFMGYIRNGLAGSDEVKYRELMKRMLRKVK